MIEYIHMAELLSDNIRNDKMSFRTLSNSAWTGVNFVQESICISKTGLVQGKGRLLKTWYSQDDVD